MIDGSATLIMGMVCTTIISDIVMTTMISGILIWKIGGGPVRDTSIQDVVVALHEVAGVDLVDIVGSSME